MVFIIWCFWRTNGLWNGSPWRQSAELAANALYAFVSVIVLFYRFPAFFIVIKYVVTSPSEDGCCQIKRKKKGGGFKRCLFPHSFFPFLNFPYPPSFLCPLSFRFSFIVFVDADWREEGKLMCESLRHIHDELPQKNTDGIHTGFTTEVRITLITGKEQETHRLHPFHRGKRVSVVCYNNTFTFARVTRLYRFGAPFTNVMFN